MATQGVLGAATLKEFEDGLHGELIRPDDEAYVEASAGSGTALTTVVSRR